MSWFDSVVSGIGDLFSGAVNVVKSIAPAAIGFFTGGGSIIGSIITTAVAGYVLNKVTKSTSQSSASSQAPPKPTNITIPPDAFQKIPVLYGRSLFSGIITEAVMSNSNTTMTFVLTLCEYTGSLLSTNFATASNFNFNAIYWGNSEIFFQDDGITAHYTQDVNGAQSSNVNGLVRVWCYAGGSANQYQVPPSGTSIATQNAWDVVPGWTSNMSMNGLVFAVVQINYSSAQGITNLDNMVFDISNSMTLPGDCLYDYMTNTRYGAGIDPSTIYAQ